jgi:hypothetical protein
MYASFADPVITEVGLDRDRQLAELLDALWRRGGPGMLQRGQRRNAGEAEPVAVPSPGGPAVPAGSP